MFQQFQESGSLWNEKIQNDYDFHRRAKKTRILIFGGGLYREKISRLESINAIFYKGCRQIISAENQNNLTRKSQLIDLK